MKNKTLLLNCSLLFALSVFKTEISNAQMVGPDAYMKGYSVEIGLDGLGGYEGANTTTSAPPAGMHPRSATGFMGFVANPQLNAWATYDGDFFTPGSPENGWGFEIGDSTTTSLGNNCESLHQISGAITAWSYVAPQTSCDWEADYSSGTDLHFKIDYQLQDADLFYITTIAITNNTASPITDLYYYRNLDPDNNEELSGDFTTQNTIISQITMGGSDTRVGATQALPWSSLFEFLAVDSNWVAGYGGFSNRDASNMYQGTGYTQTVGATNLADEAIYIAYHIPVLAPSVTQTFKFATIFDTASVAIAATALAASTVSTHNLADLQNNISVYPNPFTENTTISIDKSVSLSNAEIHIFDVIGKEVKVFSDIQSHELTIGRDGLKNGMYFYKLINKGLEIGTGKLIIK